MGCALRSRYNKALQASPDTAWTASGAFVKRVSWQESMDYDEQEMIEYRVIHHHRNLLTRFEYDTWCAFIDAGKAKAYGEADRERGASDVWGNPRDPRIDAIVERGYEGFSRNVTGRVMGERGDQVILNRCPKCSRIVRTPKAKQCLWCFHDWH